MLYLIICLVLTGICAFLALWDDTVLAYLWGIFGCVFLFGAMIFLHELMIAELFQ